MDDVTIAFAIHVLIIALWIRGVAMVAIVVVPAVRRFKSAEEPIAFFKTIERRFAWQAPGAACSPAPAASTWRIGASSCSCRWWQGHGRAADVQTTAALPLAKRNA